MIVAATKADYVRQLKDKLQTSDQWAVRGLLAIYDRQTNDEQSDNATIEKNGIGFSQCDCEILSALARSAQRYGGSLSPKQLAIVKRLMPRYARQLFAMTLERGTVAKVNGVYQNTK